MSRENDNKVEIKPGANDTLGHRLRHFREVEVAESREKFTRGLGITPRTLERYENDESVPDASFFTSLNARYHGTINLDWLLTGKGTVYLTGGIANYEDIKEDNPDYHDDILRRMHEQLNRIYREKDFLKLAAIQSLINLADPERPDEKRTLFGKSDK